MSERLPLTMQGLDVGLDAAMEGDPRAVKDWGRRCLQVGGWGHAERLREAAVPFLQTGRESHFGGGPRRVLSVAPAALTELHEATGEAFAALTERQGGMPQSLEDALIAGWAALRAHEAGRWSLLVFDSGRWRTITLLSMSPGWGWQATAGLEPASWGALSDEAKAGIAIQWPRVVAWKETGARAPWEPANVIVGDDAREVFDRLGVSLTDDHGQLRSASAVLEDVRAALERLPPDEALAAGAVLFPRRSPSTLEAMLVDHPPRVVGEWVNRTRWAHDLNVALAIPEVRATIERALVGPDPDFRAFAVEGGGVVEREGRQVSLGDLSGRRVTYHTGVVREYLAGRLAIQAGDFVGVSPDGQLRQREPGDAVAGVAVLRADGSVGVQTSGLATVRLPGPPLVLGPVEQIRAEQENQPDEEGP